MVTTCKMVFFFFLRYLSLIPVLTPCVCTCIQIQKAGTYLVKAGPAAETRGETRWSYIFEQFWTQVRDTNSKLKQPHGKLTFCPGGCQVHDDSVHTQTGWIIYKHGQMQSGKCFEATEQTALSWNDATRWSTLTETQRSSNCGAWPWKGPRCPNRGAHLTTLWFLTIKFPSFHPSFGKQCNSAAFYN